MLFICEGISKMLILRYILSAIAVGYAAGKSVQAGPQDAMANLHGVLMHGDAKKGDDHKGEDKMKVLLAKDELRDGQAIGPQDRMSELHDKLMHQDGKGAHDMKQQGPDKEKDTAVKDAMDHLHGVLMHGDSAKGKDHGHEDAKKVEDKKTGNVQVGNLMEDVHGVLMHGDRGRGKDHKHEDAKLGEGESQRGDAGVDPEQALHKGPHKHNEEVQENKEDFDPNQLWDKEKKKEGRKLAFSFGRFISDDIMDGVDKLKKRYLSRFFGGAGKNDDLNAKKKDDLAKLKKRVVSPRMKAALKFGPRKEDGPSGSGKIPPHDET